MGTATALLAALLLDGIFGEPDVLWRRLPHPAVLMGQAVAWADKRFNAGTARQAKGAATIAGLTLAAAVAAAAIGALPLGAVWEVLAAAVLLAQKSLAEHVSAVARGLRDNLPAGRAAVARIVGRDTAEMDEPAVARAAIESAGENLSDGVVAPAFWFLLLGLPGMAAYKMVNTADSMIGYRTPRHADFGRAAARFDDALNWIPARLTAVLLAALAGRLSAWPEIRADARRHRSPNAGWPEASLARALDVALAGPRSYGGQRRSYPYVHPAGRHEIGAAAIDAAVAFLWRAWAGLVALIGVLSLL